MDMGKRTSGDTLHALAKAGLGSVPIVGVAMSEAFCHFVATPMEKRRQAWMSDVGERLVRLEAESSVDVQSLQSNDAFIDTVIQATSIAMKTSQREKLVALQNAIANAARGECPDAAQQHMFLRLIDDFTEWHLRILFLFQAPREWFTRNSKSPPGMTMGSLQGIVFTAFPELRNHPEMTAQIWRDLYSRGLVSTESLHGNMTANGLFETRTTGRGSLFLRFIQDPKQ